MEPKRSNTVIATLLAALLIPRIQKWTGVTLTIDDIVALMAGAVVGFHGCAAVFEKYFPPKETAKSVNP